MRKRTSGSAGQATVEMALVLPLLIWLLVGMVDIARMSNAFLTVQYASREAVRLGATGASDTAVTDRGKARATGMALDPALVTVSVTPAGAKASGSDITVTVSYRYKVMALMGIIGSEVPLQATLTARVE